MSVQMDQNGNLQLYSGDGKTGLANLGNTCFLNAIIQCLSHTDPLRQYFLSNRLENDLKTSSEDTKQGMTAYLLGLLLRQMWSNKYHSLKPTKLKSMITSLSDNFFGGGQQDAHELLTYLLVRLHSDINRIKSQTNFNLNIEDLEECLETLADSYWKRFKASNDSIIVDLFFFQPLSSVECDVCSKSSFNLSEDCYIPVPIIEDRRKIDLYDCLNEYFTEEYLRDGNEWYCPRCKRNRTALKKYSLWSLPSIAIIQLKRFGFDDNYCLRKIKTEVDFPLNGLNLNKYCHKSNDKNKSYNLYAVVNHIGSLSNGHYIALAKTDRSVWRRFDDNYVEDITESQVKTRSAYILFYKRSDI